MLGSHGAGRILGRFAYLFGEEGTQALEDAACREQIGSADRLKMLAVGEPGIVSFASTVPLLFLMLSVAPPL